MAWAIRQSRTNLIPKKLFFLGLYSFFFTLMCFMGAWWWVMGAYGHVVAWVYGFGPSRILIHMHMCNGMGRDITDPS